MSASNLAQRRIGNNGGLKGEIAGLDTQLGAHFTNHHKTPIIVSEIYVLSQKTEMKVLTVKEKLRDLKVFTPQDIRTVYPNLRQSTLYDWEVRGYVKKIRNKFYIFADQEISGLDYYLISNEIYSPSYVSLELALNHYGIIPEAVQQITAITTRKTATFDTPLGTFSYKSIKPELFWGYRIIDHEKIGIKISDPEKTILDFLYLNPNIVNIENFEALRFNQDILRELLDDEKISKYLRIFSNRNLDKRIKILYKYLH